MSPSELPIQKFEAIYHEWRGRGDLAPDIERHLTERTRYLKMLSDILTSLPGGSKVLELGCGTGIDSCILSEQHPDLDFFGIDIASGSLDLVRRISRKTKAHVRLIRGDVFHLPFAADAFSLIFHQGLIEHFPSPEGMMREQARALADKGWAVISVPQTYTGYTVMKRGRIRAGTWPWGWERSYTAGGLRRLGRRAGLSPAKTCGEGYWRSWGEPAWVLRDLYGKLHRRNPFSSAPFFQKTLGLWERLWSHLEKWLGHLFCKNVIVSFEKKIQR